MKWGLGVSSVGMSSVWAFCFVLRGHSLFIMQLIKSAHVYHSFLTSTFQARHRSLRFSVPHCPGARRGDSDFLLCVGAGGVGSCLLPVPLFALGCDTEAVQLANKGLSEHMTLSPYFLKMPKPNGKALRQHLI